MPMIPTVFVQMVQTNIANNFSSVSGFNPLTQADPRYFIEMCQAIGNGIANSTKTLSFTSFDQGFVSSATPGILTPVVPGIGMGHGITVDQNIISEKIYTNARNAAMAKYGKITHDVYPPSAGNSGEYLKAISDGIAKAVKDHFMVAWTLNSTHLTVYSGSGEINPAINHSFSGIVSPLVSSSIQSNSPSLKGEFWPDLCDSIAKGYTEGVLTTAKSNITIIGTCIPITPPAGYLACNIPGSGTGNGVAV